MTGYSLILIVVAGILLAGCAQDRAPVTFSASVPLTGQLDYKLQ